MHNKQELSISRRLRANKITIKQKQQTQQSFNMTGFMNSCIDCMIQYQINKKFLELLSRYGKIYTVFTLEIGIIELRYLVNYQTILHLLIIYIDKIRRIFRKHCFKYSSLFIYHRFKFQVFFCTDRHLIDNAKLKAI